MIGGDDELHLLDLLGGFRLRSRNNLTVFIPSKKSRALIGILALSREGERSRIWLQNILWCRCQRAEAQNSLRRELSNLRSLLLSAAPDLLEISRDTIKLRLDRCRIDAFAPDADMQRLLEGLDLAGEEEFEDWLRKARTGPTPSYLPAAQPKPDRSFQGYRTQDHRLVVTIKLEPWHDGGADAEFLPELLRQTMSLGLQESGYFRINAAASADASEETPDIHLRIKTRAKGDELALIIMASLATTGELLFTMQDVVAIEPHTWNTTIGKVHAVAAICIDRIVDKCIVNAGLRDERHRARKELLSAIEQMFSLNREKVTASRTTLLLAQGLENQSTFHAWKAYQAIFRHDLAHDYNYSVTLEQCREDLDVALCLDPFNGVTLSLGAHINAFLFRDMERAWELLERAASIGTRNIMYFDARALLLYYSGRYNQARDTAWQAASLGHNLSFRYCFSTSLSMIEAVSGNLDTAIAHGRKALALEPLGKQFSYPPTLRFLGAALAHGGYRDEARQAFSLLGNANEQPIERILGTTGGTLPGVGGTEFIRSAISSAGL
ncbi:MAG: hypothetical protein ACRCUE_00950 [Bosea sp. (in: a-proteobacteria)]